MELRPLDEGILRPRDFPGHPDWANWLIFYRHGDLRRRVAPIVTTSAWADPASRPPNRARLRVNYRQACACRSPSDLLRYGFAPGLRLSTIAQDRVYFYLTMTVGHRAGTNYLLDGEADNRIGRGTECMVMLTDPLCSRVHAIVRRQNGAWRVFDAGSRNGTFVNGQKIDEAVLGEGHYLRLGSTEFAFHESEQTPAISPVSDLNVTQTVVKDALVAEFDSKFFATGACATRSTPAICCCCISSASSCWAVATRRGCFRRALELLRSRTRASVVGFLWVDDDGKLKPKLVVPESATQAVALNESLTRLVLQEKHAVWIASQQADGGAHNKALDHYADALCVPLVSRSKVLGAVHVYLDRGRFRQSHFDFAISVANITAVALVRAVHEESLLTDFKQLKEKWPGYDELVGESPAMQELKTKIGRLGRTSGCVLIRGESGTGKELIARALHRASPRADRPMLAVNCAAIPAELIDSQLFGHKAGSFTGADRDHIGVFQQADLGTLFLDEIGEMTLGGAIEIAARAGRTFLPAGRRHAGDQGRRADRGSHESRPAGLRSRKEIPRGLVLPAQRLRAGSPGAARPWWRHQPADRLFPGLFFGAARSAGLASLASRA